MLTLARLVHLSGPPHRSATCCIDTSESKSGKAKSGVPSSTLGGKQAQTERWWRFNNQYKIAGRLSSSVSVHCTIAQESL